jgi:hypothetical protein
MLEQHHEYSFRNMQPASRTNCRPGKTLNSAAGLPARVQIPVPPSATSRLLYELLGRVSLGFLVVSPFRIACVFLHVERGRSSKRVWRSPRILYLFTYFLDIPLVTSSNTGCMGRSFAENSQSIWFFQGLSSSLFPTLRRSLVSVLVI